jgi:hypothetical protein
MKKNPLYKVWVILVILSLVQGACRAVSLETKQPQAEEPTATEEISQEPTVGPGAEATQPPESTQVPNTGSDTWLVMLYQDADDEALEGGSFFDLNEAELVGSSDQVKIVSQLDRFKGGFTGDGDWTTARRYLLLKDNYWDTISSPVIEDLGEIDSGNWKSMVDFAIWAIQNYPAEHYVLVMSDHGSGWLGANSDEDPGPEKSRMSTNQIDQALSEIISQTGIGQFELVGFDACLMAQMEVLTALVPYAHYGIASEETEPSLGWAYTEPLAQLSANPSMSGADLAKLFVQSYINQDLLVVNDQARQLVLKGKDLPLDMSAEELAAQYSDVTMSAFDLSSFVELDQATNDLALALEQADQSGVAAARAYAQMFSPVFIDAQPHFMDLGHFGSMLLENFPSNASIQQSVGEVQSALQRVVIAEKHGPQRPGATGLSIYFPNSELFQATTGPDVGYRDYAGAVARFSRASLWDDFLRYYYTSEPFSADSVDLAVLNPVTGAPVALETPVPQEPGEVVAPGAGQITIAPLTLSAEQITNEETVTVSTDIQGSNIAYVYFFVFLQDEETNSYLLMDTDYASSENVREINGVYYPDWGNGQFTLDYDWTPTVFYLNNGTDEVFALFEPDTYGLGAEDTFYRVNGYYTFADSGERYRSVMFFNANGDFDSVWVYTDENSAAREVYPAVGDEFTVIENWLEYDQNPDGELVDYEGGTLAFTEEPMRFVPYPPRGGTYVVGMAVEDMDGNLTFQLIGIPVTEK